MHCRICDAGDFSLAIDLKNQPCANLFLNSEEIGKEPFYPLRVVYCNGCQTAQLDHTVKKEFIYSDKNTYLSGITASLKKHFDAVALEVDQSFFAHQPQKSILDIGSNDGTQLASYKKLGYDVLGVESGKRIAEIANNSGIETLHAFYNLDTAQKIGRKFDVFNASGVFFHLEELHSVTQGIKQFLKEDGVFVVQFLYMKNILENRAFDQIYHEHLVYYTLRTLQVLLKRHGLELFDTYFSSIHGGSCIGYIGHPGKREKTKRLKKMEQEENLCRCNDLESYQKFAKEIEILKIENLHYLQTKKREGKRIFGMGAPVKGNTLLNYFDIGSDLLECLVEKNELRKGLFSPGKHLPIRIEKELSEPPDVYYVLAWNFKKEILANNQHLIEKGVEFYFPVNPKEHS